MPYAQDTSVSIARSKGDIETLLTKKGADQFMLGSDRASSTAGLMFRLQGRHVRLSVPIPGPDSPQAQMTDGGRRRTAGAAAEWAAKEERRLWRALFLVIKAKIEAVDSGIVSFEQEWGMHFLLPNGTTVAEWVMPDVDVAYETGRMPELTPWTVKAIER